MTAMAFQTLKQLRSHKLYTFKNQHEATPKIEPRALCANIKAHTVETP